MYIQPCSQAVPLGHWLSFLHEPSGKSYNQKVTYIQWESSSFNCTSRLTQEVERLKEAQTIDTGYAIPVRYLISQRPIFLFCKK